MSLTVATRAVPRLRVDVLEIERLLPDTERAHRLHGIAMVETFTVPLPDGRLGRCWIATADAFTVGAFGRVWIAHALRRRAVRIGDEELIEQLAQVSGCRLTPAD